MAPSSILHFRFPRPGCLSPQGPKIAQNACAETLRPIRLLVRTRATSSDSHDGSQNIPSPCFPLRICKRIAAMKIMPTRILLWRPRPPCARVLHLRPLDLDPSKLLSPEVPVGATALPHPRGHRLRGLCFKNRMLHQQQLSSGRNLQIVVPPRRQDHMSICEAGRRQ